MSVLDRKLGRELFGSKGVLLAIMSIITIGVMCFVYMRSAYYNLGGAQSQYYQQGRMADFWVDVSRVPLAQLDLIAELPGVSEIRSRIQFYVTVDLPRVDRPLNGLVLSLPEQRRRVLNDIVLRRGSYFSSRRENEVIVTDAFAKAHDLHPGEWIHLILNNRRQEMRIVGTAISPEFVYQLGPGAITPDPSHFGVFYVKHPFAKEVFDFDGAANQIIGLLDSSGHEHSTEIYDRIERLLEPYGVFAVTPREEQASNRFLTDEIKGLGVFSAIIPGIFLSVAALVLNVLLSRLVDQQRVVIGTFKALGYRDRTIVWHFVKFATVVGVLGGVLGCVGGYVMAFLMMQIYRQYFEFPSLDNRLYAEVYLIGIAISLTCALAGSIQGVRATLRLRPAESMRPKPPARGGTVWVERIGWLWRRLSFSWRVVLRSVVRNRLRTAVGLFAAAMGTSLLFVSLIMSAGLVYLIDFQFEKVLRDDVRLTFESERGEQALFDVRHLKGVDHAEPLLEVACTFQHGNRKKKGGITGLVANAQLTIPRDQKGRRIRVPESGLVLSRKMAQLLDVGVGQTIRIRPTKGLQRESQVRVAAIADTYLGISVYADLHFLSRLIGEQMAMTSVQLQIDSEPTAQRSMMRRLKELPALQAVDVRADMVENLKATFIDTNYVFITISILFAGVIFFGSILNASLVSLAERQREVATLRALGYTRRQVGGLFLKESMSVNLLGTMLGLPLGYGLGAALSIGYDTEMFRFPIVAPASAWIWTVVLANLFGLLAHLVVQRMINRLDYLGALNVRE